VCKRAGLLIGWDDGSKRALVTWANCDSWRCKECANRMTSKWSMRAEMGCRKMIAQGDTLDFVTITSHEKIKTFEATEKVWRNAWAKLYNALKRQKPALEYMIIPEKHEDGRMHVHALWNAGVSKRWLKDNARKRGLGYQAEIKHVSSSGSAAKYVTKYVGKNLGVDVPNHFRRVRVSQNWAEIPKPDNALVGLRWEHIGTNGALQVVYEECQTKNITLIDLESGQIFDDVDLGTTIYA
jgi:hypothetical protein